MNYPLQAFKGFELFEVSKRGQTLSFHKTLLSVAEQNHIWGAPDVASLWTFLTSEK